MVREASPNGTGEDKVRVKHHKSPEQFRDEIVRDDKSKLILGIDLGTNCGYSFHFWRPGQPACVLPQHMGQWDLSAGSYDSGAIRFVRLRQFLSAVRPDLVCYEDVKFDPPAISKMNAGAIIARVSTASELLGAFKCTVCTWCEENDIPCTGFKITQVKKRATGKGNANKEAMIAACNEQFGSVLDPEGYESSGVDNIADAAWICFMAQEQYALGLPLPEEGKEDVDK